MPPFHRKTLVLVGANGVGRRSLKERLIKSDNRRFAAAIPRECNICFSFSQTKVNQAILKLTAVFTLLLICNKSIIKELKVFIRGGK